MPSNPWFQTELSVGSQCCHKYQFLYYPLSFVLQNFPSGSEWQCEQHLQVPAFHCTWNIWMNKKETMKIMKLTSVKNLWTLKKSSFHHTKITIFLYLPAPLFNSSNLIRFFHLLLHLSAPCCSWSFLFPLISWSDT